MILYFVLVGFKKGYRGESKKKQFQKHNADTDGKRKGGKSEIKRKEQILKERRKKQKQASSQKHRELKRNKRKAMHSGKKRGR